MQVRVLPETFTGYVHVMNCPAAGVAMIANLPWFFHNGSVNYTKEIVMNIGWPQLIVIALMLFGSGISTARYGQQKTDCHDIVDIVIGPTIMLALLYWGGFFS